MTIEQLIELLKTQPSDMRVYIFDSEWGCLQVDELKSGINEGYYPSFDEKVFVIWSK